MTEILAPLDTELEAGLRLAAELSRKNPVAAVALCRTLLNGQLVQLERRNMQAVKLADRIDALLDSAPNTIKECMHNIGRLGITQAATVEAIAQCLDDLTVIAQWQTQAQKMARLLALGGTAVDAAEEKTASSAPQAIEERRQAGNTPSA